MDEYKRKIQSVDKDKSNVPTETVPLWERPDVTFVGGLGDLIQGVGVGKTGPRRDGDPFVDHFPPGQ
jgi:hypothetical protein